MFRASIIRSARVLSRPRVLSCASKLLVIQSVRFETTKASPKTPYQQALKAAQKQNDDLQRDWDAKELTYEELKPRTNSPTPVCVHGLLSNITHDTTVGHVLG